MNNKFIPIISFFMTVSLIVFVLLQFYWLKGYYGALNQDFSNRVNNVLENTSKKVQDIEMDKYLNKDNNNFGREVIATSDQPVQTYIQQKTDSGSKTSITWQKGIIEKEQIPVSNRGDSLIKTKLYTDEGILKINRVGSGAEPLTAQMNRDLNNNTFTLREFVKLNGTNLPIEKRVTAKILDSVLKRELKLNGINTQFGFGVLDKNNKETKVANALYRQEKSDQNYTYPLFTDRKDRTLYSLALTFPNKGFSLAKDNFTMLLGSLMSLLAILGIYAVSVNYMLRQKKIAEVKTDFINNMSHEFKTPLATISLASDSLSNDKIATNPDKVKYYSSLIKQENLRMKKQVENVLNMSKLERNEVKLFLRETNMRELINKISDSFNLIVRERNGSLSMHFNATQFKFKVDEFHISNALVNLLDNANKYSPETPEIGIKTYNEGNWYVIEISDKGMGLETQNRQKVFEKFFREETGNIHNVKGQGLGLSYVKKIIELHKGLVSVESEVGKGSTFTVKLPLT